MVDNDDAEKWVVDTRSNRVLKFWEFIQRRGQTEANFKVKKYDTKKEAEKFLRSKSFDNKGAFLKSLDLDEQSVEDLSDEMVVAIDEIIQDENYIQVNTFDFK